MKRFRFLQVFFLFVFCVQSSSIKSKRRQSSQSSLKMSRQFRWINGFTRERKNIKIYFKYLISLFFLLERICVIYIYIYILWDQFEMVLGRKDCGGKPRLLWL